MQFGHLENLQGIDFALPPDHPVTASYLPGKPAGHPPEIYVGVSRWNVPAWKNTYYPKGTKDALPVYANTMNGIELNTTHYRIPTGEQVQRWKQAVSGRDFVFSPKFPQVISHRGSLSAQGNWTPMFIAAMRQLEHHLGHSFLQLPPTFGPSRTEELIRFMKDMPAGFPYGIELRHPGWATHHNAFEQVMAVMHQQGVIPVISDTAGRRDTLHMCLPTPVLMLRWLGNNGHPTDEERLHDWVDRIYRWHQQGLHRVYWFIHQHDDNYLLPTIKMLRQMLQEKIGVPLPPTPPTSIQASLF